ncbi:LAQU0S23e00848g1_1 [Lachancea quebecensis]|uniref:LAQU0S23e00848g1_1 n=1 Tax=Lachancea quebecensis TaxID=1654605 RepID=A0A0P1KY91_9SACH|nr:LAQU0S23e00848g1_1 [Lachancea quebecensis]
MSNPDDLLLELIYEYKPHLQSYRHRMNTWNELLRAFNRKTGASYRQNRTLKTRFEKLKELYINNEELPFSNVGLLEELLKEDRRDYKYAKLRRQPSGAENDDSEPPLSTETVPQPPQQTEERSDSGVQSNEETVGTQPPPLDSITVFPHTQMRRYQERQDQHHDFSPGSRHQPQLGESSVHNSNTPSDASASPSRFSSNKQQALSTVDSSRSDMGGDRSYTDSLELQNCTTLEALRREVALMKQNQEIFQKDVIMKLNKIVELLQEREQENEADFLNLPFSTNTQHSPG